jgi:nucleoside-diphosphate-sugar epimerase
MKIFVAGATGALGKLLVPRLVAEGHEVVGMTRSASKVETLRSLGATPVVGDALNPEDVARAVAEAEPEVIVHQLTALAGALDGGEPDQFMALTNRLRIEATDHLLAAGRAVGARCFVAQSYAGSGMPFARIGGPVKNEDDPLDPTPPKGMRNSIEAIRQLEAAVIGAEWTEGIVLRYGSFYGPGTALAGDGAYFELIRRRKFPLVGSAAGVWSFIHIEDAAEATVAAIQYGQRGLYHIVDDEPAAVAEWLPTAASVLGAQPPWRVPRWMGRLLAGEAMTVMMTEVRGASNAKAKRELGWRPAHPSWRQGFAEVAA